MADDRAPEAKTEAQAPKPQRDLRQEITDRLVQSLDQGRIPWDRPWQNLEHGLPRNMATGREYRSGNRFMLMMAQIDNAYADPRFGTVQQINALGGRVKKGEHGHPVELWKEQPFWERRDVSVTLNGMRVKVFDATRDGTVQIGMPTDQASTLNVKTSDLHIVQHKNGEKLSLDWKQAKELDSVVGRTFTVFNAEQCTGLKIEPLPKPEQTFDTVQRGEQIKTAMERDGLTFAEHPKFAFYSPKRDEVSLPPQGQFNEDKGYYGTLLHEIGHATGAEKRLNREGITGDHRFGSEGYAKEELRAEMFSMMMAAETGIPHDPQQHTAYVQSWAKVLKQDKNEIFRAAAEAGKAVDYVLAKEQSLQVMQERQASAKTAALAASQPVPELDAAKSVAGISAATATRATVRAPAIHETLESDGWVRKPTGSYEKTFVLSKDVNQGGEFTHGKSVAEKILNVRMSGSDFVVSHGWEDTRFPMPAGGGPADAAHQLDQDCKNLLTKEHAHLGVTAVRGQNEPVPQPGMTVDAERQRLAAAVQREDALLSAQPHEMTFAEFSTVASAKKLGPGHGRQWEVFNGSPKNGKSLGFADGPTEEGALRQAHRREVNNLLYDHDPKGFRPEGARPLSMPPPHVLAEYPDLQKKWGHVINSAPEAGLTPQATSAYDQAIQNFVRGGGNEKDAHRTLDSELAGDYDAKNLPAALVFHGFAKPAAAEKLAAAIIAEENKKVLDKEDRKSSEFHLAKQAEEAAGKDKRNAAERAVEKSSEPEGDKPERPARPRLRQTSRKAAAMER